MYCNIDIYKNHYNLINENLTIQAGCKHLRHTTKHTYYTVHINHNFKLHEDHKIFIYSAVKIDFPMSKSQLN